MTDTPRPPATADGAGHLEDVLLEVAQWGHETFPASTDRAKFKHLREEVRELEAEPDRAEEWADVVMILAHIASAHGYLDRVTDEVVQKLAICRKRIWGQPDADGMVKAIKPSTTAEGAGRLSADDIAGIRRWHWASAPDGAGTIWCEGCSEQEWPCATAQLADTADALRAALATAERERDAERTRNAPLREAIKEAQDRADGHESAALTATKLAARAQCRYQHILRRADRLGTSLTASESRARALREALDELFDALAAYERSSADADKGGSIAAMLEIHRNTDIKPRSHWRPEAVRLYAALDALAEANDGPATQPAAPTCKWCWTAVPSWGDVCASCEATMRAHSDLAASDGPGAAPSGEA